MTDVTQHSRPRVHDGSRAKRRHWSSMTGYTGLIAAKLPSAVEECGERNDPCSPRKCVCSISQKATGSTVGDEPVCNIQALPLHKI